MPSAPLKVFILYAHEDKDVRDKLLRHLRVQVVRGDLELWSDHEIKPGDTWDEAIRDRLEQSELLLLLVSDDFFNSDYIQNVELREAARRHAAGECRLLPVIARDCDWQDHPLLGRIQALPPGGKPVKSKGWDSEDEPYRAIVEGVKTAVRQLRPAAPRPKVPPAPKRPFPRSAVLLSAALLLAALLGRWAWVWYQSRPPAVAEPASTTSLPEQDSLKNKATRPDTPAKKAPPPAASPAPKTSEKQPQTQPAGPAKNPEKRGDTRPAPAFDRAYDTVEGMTRGKKGRKFGFQNTATGKVIGWYDDAMDFSAGRARVKQNGLYFYIDKSGRCVEDCE